RSVVNLADLADQPFVMVPRAGAPDLHDALIAACRASGILPKIAQEALWTHTALSLVAIGLGVTLLPASARSLRVSGVKFIALDGYPINFQWDLAIASPKRTASPTIRAFMKMAKDIADASSESRLR